MSGPLAPPPPPVYHNQPSQLYPSQPPNFFSPALPRPVNMITSFNFSNSNFDGQLARPFPGMGPLKGVPLSTYVNGLPDATL